MNVLGIDVGFSTTKKTSCYCALSLKDKVISFSIEPYKFDVNYDLQSIIKNQGFDIIAIDAPLTPVLISEKPKTGRKIEKLFSNGIFSNSPYRGPQPSSIAVPAQGFPLYQAGMKIVANLNSYRYLSITEIRKGCRKGIYEVLPKMTQSLLFPRQIVANRSGQFDDYLFPLLLKKSGQYRHLLDALLGEYRFSVSVEKYIENINPNRHHEELASILCSFQAVLIAIGKSTIVGFDGDNEGYYGIPSMNYWDLEWYECFAGLTSKKFKDAIII